MDIVEGELVPALDEVGEGFEKKTVFLPQLLMSAEAAGRGVRGRARRASPPRAGRRARARSWWPPCRATSTTSARTSSSALLENYGYTVVDLGKDVPPEAVVEAVRQSGAPPGGPVAP